MRNLKRDRHGPPLGWGCVVCLCDQGSAWHSSPGSIYIEA
jgi:hypothetical protein